MNNTFSFRFIPAMQTSSCRSCKISLRTFWGVLHDQVVTCDQALRGFLKGKREKEEERKETGFESGEGDR